VAGATPTPLPTADPVQTAPPEGAADEDWFADAVFIGDSRTDGFRLYSGVTHADFLAVTGLNVYDVMNGKKVIRAGEEKVSILDALSQKQYGKVYISLGVNELGYHDPEGFTDTYGQIIDAVRALQPEAVLYIQSIIPVNAEKCLANSQPAYVTNEAIADYNAALSALCEEKQVPFLDLSQALADETGEVPAEDSADGIHFKRSGYVKWKDYLLAHTTP
jgi:lysophospholipase L1-like esterase